MKISNEEERTLKNQKCIVVNFCYEILLKIKLIDETIFPDKPLSILLDNFTEVEFEASYHFNEKNIKDESKHYYMIWLKGASKRIKKNNLKMEALRVAIHEVRHRVQHDSKKIRLLNHNDLKFFIVNNPKNRLEKYFSSPNYGEFIDFATKKSPHNFDAMVLEDIAMRLLNNNYDDENIRRISLSVINQSAEDVIKKLIHEDITMKVVSDENFFV